ncbi:hypothetical protein PBCV1_a644aR [Paramecium bursaria Chlorella virus 1]|uniref:Uncharacterized protein n=1 Tax=Paramecium bursaria Chlorella virus 1 TaxID=10506 RepID=F8TU78_PBCV1|nr:hypothetical protein PBCV1_a644aR [Paramecium bursaria Chlorella virus 1]AEI70139.1 hypothetical protein [Paramecium bursaria Chlorella virus 1]
MQVFHSLEVVKKRSRDRNLLPSRGQKCSADFCLLIGMPVKPIIPIKPVSTILHINS